MRSIWKLLFVPYREGRRAMEIQVSVYRVKMLGRSWYWPWWIVFWNSPIRKRADGCQHYLRICWLTIELTVKLGW